MFGRKFKLQFYLLAVSIVLILYSLIFLQLYSINLENYYARNRLLIRYVENFLRESEILLINKKYKEFERFLVFFYNSSKLRKRDVSILALNLSINLTGKKINYSLILFDEINYNLNISSDKSFSFIMVIPKRYYSGILDFERNSTVLIRFNNFYFEVFCKELCTFLVSIYREKESEIVKTLKVEI